jgi:hypothetical protein
MLTAVFQSPLVNWKTASSVTLYTGIAATSEPNPEDRTGAAQNGNGVKHPGPFVTEVSTCAADVIVRL